MQQRLQWQSARPEQLPERMGQLWAPPGQLWARPGQLPDRPERPKQLKHQQVGPPESDLTALLWFRQHRPLTLVHRATQEVLPRRAQLQGLLRLGHLLQQCESDVGPK